LAKSTQNSEIWPILRAPKLAKSVQKDEIWPILLPVFFVVLQKKRTFAPLFHAQRIMEQLIGRKREVAELMRCYHSERSEFVILYGRRRIGKTFLVNHTFGNRFAFQFTGSHQSSKERQLEVFAQALQEYGGMGYYAVPDSWHHAFDALRNMLQRKRTKGKKVVFFDEMPWIDTYGSEFVAALEDFWNAWATARKEQDIVLIVCGSSTSWITNKIINNHGGLHNRLTSTIHLEPFTLNECEKFAKTAQLGFSRTDIANAYMIFGGVPFYWSLLKRTESLPQNIDRLFFDKDAKLKYEYREMFASLFKDPSLHLKALEELCKKKAGLTREQLAQSPDLKNDGTLTKILEELEQCGFIQRYHKIGQEKKRLPFPDYRQLRAFPLQIFGDQQKHRQTVLEQIAKYTTTKHMVRFSF